MGDGAMPGVAPVDDQVGNEARERMMDELARVMQAQRGGEG